MTGPEPEQALDVEPGVNRSVARSGDAQPSMDDPGMNESGIGKSSVDESSLTTTNTAGDLGPSLLEPNVKEITVSSMTNGKASQPSDLGPSLLESSINDADFTNPTMPEPETTFQTIGADAIMTDNTHDSPQQSKQSIKSEAVGAAKQDNPSSPVTTNSVKPDPEMSNIEPKSSQPLFFRDSDDDEEEKEQKPRNGHGASSPIRGSKREHKDMEATDTEDVIPVSSPAYKLSKAEQRERKNKSEKRPTALVHRSSSSLSSSRLESFVPRYIGQWTSSAISLTKGTSLGLTRGSHLFVERQKSKEEIAALREAKRRQQSRNTTSVFGQTRPVTSQVKGGNFIRAAGSAPPSSAKKRATPTNTVVRFVNDRGFEVGRLSAHDGHLIHPLIDAGYISLKCVVASLPSPLQFGDTIKVRIKVFLTKKVFQESVAAALDRTDGQDMKRALWKAHEETAAELLLKGRRAGLAALFSKINLKPCRASSLTKSNKKLAARALAGRVKNPDEKALAKFGQKLPNSSKHSSDSEASGDDEEVLDDKQLDEIDNLYQRAQRNDTALNEMDPPETFTYTLRPYQKQALSWMVDLEGGRLNQRESSIHPLWEQYVFRDEAEDDARVEGKLSARNKKGASNAQPLTIEDSSDEEYAQDSLHQDDGDAFYYNPYDGDLSLDFPKANHRSKGGILADAMGMGKTCMMAALIHQNRLGDKVRDEDEDDIMIAQEPTEAERANKRPRFKQITLSKHWLPVTRSVQGKSASFLPPHATLVVCPVSLATQWQEELERMSVPGTLKVTLWYGDQRGDLEVLLHGRAFNNDTGVKIERDPLDEDQIENDDGDDDDPSGVPREKQRVDVVITTYGTLVSEHANWQKRKDLANYEGGGLFDIAWLRVVLDEAHSIKNRLSKAARASFDLDAQRRWALTGTPIVNRLEDLYSLLHFLKLEPWGIYPFFRTFVTTPFLNQDPKALDVVQFILQQCLLRREKNARDRDGKLILDLPEKTVALKKLTFSPEERRIYDSIYSRSKRRFLMLDQEGKIKSSYTSILAMLMR